MHLTKTAVIFLSAVCMSGLAGSAIAGDKESAVRQERLAKYSFLRTQYDPGAIGLLIGNAEIGGLCDVSGLGISKIWAADIWKNEQCRMAVDGPVLYCREFTDGRKPVSYRQELKLTDGVLRTSIRYEDGSGYDAELICSMDVKHLVVLNIKNIGGAGERTWLISRPSGKSAVTNSANDIIIGQVSDGCITPYSWGIRASRLFSVDAEGKDCIKIEPGADLTLVFCLMTGSEGAEYIQLCSDTLAGNKPSGKRFLKNHIRRWSELWEQSAVLAIPDPAMEKLWYRSLFWMLCTCGSEQYLPGESMFAVDCWGMRSFTYGASGWAVQACTAAGFPGIARTMLNWHYKPDALKKNAGFYTTRLAGKTVSPEALAFAHEVKPDGERLPADFWELQRHLDGFAAALFYHYNRFYPDDKYYREVVYPVLRGTAIFFQGMLSRDEKTGELILPRMTSLTEDLSAVNPIDAALAAKWCFVMAARAAVELDCDPELRQSWKELAGGICVPQTTERYLEYFGDEEKRPGGGYQGVRGFVYLSYPTMELIPLLDRGKTVNSLDYTWVRNNHGEGMISFVANWFALADTHLGRGEHALTIMRHNLRCMDRWDTSLRETQDNHNYYFTTSYTSFLLVPLSMALQSGDGRISSFPAVPAEWKDFAFYNVPAEAGIRVSGEMKDGKVIRVTYTSNGSKLLETGASGVVEIKSGGSEVITVK